MFDDQDSVSVRGANALFTLGLFRNVQVQFGRCPCDSRCTNLRVEVFRLSDDTGEPVMVSAGVGPSLWEAALQAHVLLIKAVEDANSRDAEIEYLEEMWDA